MSGEASFTQRPWKWSSDYLTAPEVKNPQGYATIIIDDYCVTDPNRALIAAAPDLYAAMKWFIDDIDSTHTVMLEFDDAVSRARAALALARGEKG